MGQTPYNGACCVLVLCVVGALSLNLGCCWSAGVVAAGGGKWFQTAILFDLGAGVGWGMTGNE
ncbi:hypothetical protein BV913_09445 [Neisseria dumasiana]|uniref:Uncharacterized protein n=1 Tax=Neisseria dumasiana TaxID=1931275 RepID=A0ABX3WJR1_9NEIS|nr:hypothetical protein BV913_09445 [Neisseria dumasiana]